MHSEKEFQSNKVNLSFRNPESGQGDSFLNVGLAMACFSTILCEKYYIGKNECINYELINYKKYYTGKNECINCANLLQFLPPAPERTR